jgi:hypothetical protein
MTGGVRSRPGSAHHVMGLVGPSASLRHDLSAKYVDAGLVRRLLGSAPAAFRDE